MYWFFLRLGINKSILLGAVVGRIVSAAARAHARVNSFVARLAGLGVLGVAFPDVEVLACCDSSNVSPHALEALQ